jgi:hypothetical protein
MLLSRRYFSVATKTPSHSQPGGLAAKKAMRSLRQGGAIDERGSLEGIGPLGCA